MVFRNAEASSSRLSEMEDEEPDPNEIYADSGGETEEDDEGEYDDWEEDPQELYDQYTDDSGSGDDYNGGESNRATAPATRLPAASQEAEEDPEGGFDRLANALQETMTAAPSGSRQDLSALASFGQTEDTEALREHGRAFQKEIAAMGDQSDEELLGDFYGRVLRPSKKQAAKARKGRPRHARHHEPASEAVELIAQANMAYIQSEFEEAIPILLEVIRIDNKVHSAWQTLAICHQELGNADMALQANLVAAHLDGDAETWKDLAARSSAYPQQALYCLKKAIKLEPDDGEALFQAAQLFKQFGDEKMAFVHFKKLIETSSDPHDFRVLREMRSLCTALPENLEIGCTYFREAFEYHLLHFSGPADQSAETVNNLDVGMLVVLIDLLLRLGDNESAIDCIKRGQRWLDGRGAEQTWAGRDDDLEYLPVTVDPRGGGKHLDVNLRHRLGLARLKLGDDEQAVQHIEEVTKLDIIEHQQFWKEAAEAMMKRPALVEYALPILSELLQHDDVEYDAKTTMNYALCQQHLGFFQEAIEAFEHIIEQDPDDLDRMMKLATAYEDAGNKIKALETVRKVQAKRETLNSTRRGGRDSDEEPEPEGADPDSAFIRGVIRRKKKRRAARKVSDRRKELQEAAAITRALWEDVQYAEEGVVNGMKGALDAFLEASGDMIEIFRMAKSNFGKDRGVKRMMMKTKRKRDAEAGLLDLDEQARMMESRLEADSIGDEPEGEDDPVGNNKEKIVVHDTHFHGIAATDWLALIVKHCCALAARGDCESALEILEHVVMAGLLYVSHEHSIALRLTAIAISMRLRDPNRVVEHEHALQSLMQWRVEPKLILLACLGHGEGPKNAFTTGPLQKRLHRELRLYNAAVSVDSLRWYPGRKRWVLDEVDGDGYRKRDKRKIVVPEEEEDDDEGVDHSGRLLKPVVVRQHFAHPNGPPVRTNNDLSMGWLPTKRQPIHYINYGLNMMSARTYQSALYYFLRAYELDANHPYLNLLIAQCYLGRAMNRKTDNKDYQIAEGLAFLSRYRKLSQPSAELEVEYNFGRAFHSIGVTHLAVNHYEKVLKLTEDKMLYEDDPEAFVASSVAGEAAHNLVLIYTTSGSPRLAKERANQWLAI